MSRKGLLTVLSAAWFIVVLFFFHFGPHPFPPQGLAILVLDTLLLCVVVASAWGLGAFLLKPLRLSEESPGEAPFFEIGAGLGGLALGIFAIAAAGILYRGVVIVFMGLGVLLLARLDHRRRDGVPLLQPWGPTEYALLGVSSLAGIMTLVGSLSPPEFYDALIYHLAVPDYYIRHHGMVPMPDNFYAGYPANMGMLYALGLLLNGGELAQSMHWLCGALTAGALTATGVKHLDRRTALLACVFFALRPGVMLISTWAIADLGVTFFGLLCFSALLNVWTGGGRRWVVAAGIFAGLALGTKYTAAIVVVAPAAVGLALRPRGGLFSRATWRTGLADLALFAGITLLLVSPWLARNVVYTGNPVAPYFTAHNRSEEPASPDLMDEIGRRLPAGADATELMWHYLSAPWTATMGRLGAGGYLGPGLLMLVPLLLFMRGLPPIVRPLSIVAGVGFVGWALSSQVTRYLFPVLPPIALLAAMAARRLPRAITLAGIGWALAYNVFLFLFLLETIGTYRVVTGAESRDDYLSRRVSYYDAASFLAEHPGPSDRVLFVGEGRGYYCPIPYAAATPFDPPILDRYVRAATDEPDLIRRLKADGFTHLLVSGPELERARGTKADDLMKSCFPSGSPRLMFEKHDVRIYALP